MATKITFTIEEELGDLSVASNGWKKQLTYMSIFYQQPKPLSAVTIYRKPEQLI